MGKIFARNDQSGQIILVVVLAAVISLTVGLSVASRVINNTKSATNETSAQKALSAAEAGIQQQLNNPVTSNSITFDNSTKVSYTSQNIASAQFLINGGNSVAQNDGADIWLSDYGNGDDPTYSNPRDTLLIIYWSDNVDASASNCNTKNPAIEVVIVSGTKNTPSITRKVYDSCTSRKSNNHFDDGLENVNKTISGVAFDHVAKMQVSNGLVARVIPHYATTKLAAELDLPAGPGTIGIQLANPPSQGRVIESTGTSGDSTRKLRVFQGYPKLPIEVFPYSLYFPNI